MLEAAEQGLKISKDEYAAAEPGLRVELINAQYDLQNADFSVVLVIAGDDRIGMNETIQFMHEWMDARYLQTHIFLLPTHDELERPRFWRYWRALPPQGRIGVYAGAWPLTRRPPFSSRTVTSPWASVPPVRAPTVKRSSSDSVPVRLAMVLKAASMGPFP